MTISAVSTTSSALDFVPLLAPYCTRDGVPSWSPNWFALDGSSILRSTQYLQQYCTLFYVKTRERLPYRNYATYGMKLSFTVSDDILRMKGLHLGDIESLLSTRVEPGENLSVATDSSSLKPIRHFNPYGTELEMLNAIAQCYSFGQNIRSQFDEILKQHYMYWGDQCQGSLGKEHQGENGKGKDHSINSTLTDSNTFSHSWIQTMGSFPVQGRTLKEWINRQPFDREFIDHCQARLSSLGPPIDITSLSNTNNGLAYMSTRRGYVGWAHCAASLGDGVFLLPGCSIPVVLRRRDGGGYTVVGEAYVQGVMSGERVRETHNSKERRLRGELMGSEPSDWEDLEIY
jgi:hypothetical protein